MTATLRPSSCRNWPSPDPTTSVAATRQRAFADGDTVYFVTLSVTAEEPTSAQLEALGLVSRSLLDDNVNPG